MRDKYGRTHYETADGNKDMYGRSLGPALGVPETNLPPRRKFVDIGKASGGQRCLEEDTERRIANECGVALVRYKSMSELMAEFPNHYFDCYGNFNTGVTTGNNYSQTNGIYDHMAPSYFAQMGMTLHRTYLLEDGIQDTWFYKVIDR